jgi:hypothetical protein
MMRARGRRRRSGQKQNRDVDIEENVRLASASVFKQYG